MADHSCADEWPFPQSHQRHHVADPDRGASATGDRSSPATPEPHISIDVCRAMEALFLDSHQTNLSLINRRWLELLCDLLGIRTKLSWSMDYQARPGRTERLVSICRQAGADHLCLRTVRRVPIWHEDLFRAAGLECSILTTPDTRSTQQLFPPFDHHVSVDRPDFQHRTARDAVHAAPLIMQPLDRRDAVPVGAAPGGVPRPGQQGRGGSGTRRLRNRFSSTTDRRTTRWTSRCGC